MKIFMIHNFQEKGSKCAASPNTALWILCGSCLIIQCPGNGQVTIGTILKVPVAKEDFSQD